LLPGSEKTRSGASGSDDGRDRQADPGGNDRRDERN
jgi:hypothetical protein